MSKSIKNTDYSSDQFYSMGQNYVKVCNLIIDNILNDKFKGFEQRQILFPLIYNLRHAAELFLKSLLLEVTIEFKGIHDLDSLIEKHSIVLEEHFNQSSCPITCKKHFSDFMTQVNLVSSNTFSDVNVIDEKDTKNSFFRYPEIKLSGEYLNLYNIDFKKLKEQIKKLNNSYKFLSTSMSVSLSFESSL